MKIELVSGNAETTSAIVQLGINVMSGMSLHLYMWLLWEPTLQSKC